ncbi:hypothetical protein CASFOL_020251 [Castilleja foliolosa]|uniref:Uncharacterized protein n=1 Tax=Castilleja foliolosa TaxID=1961234 RepID=A0ABD3D337_9LAMI
MVAEVSGGGDGLRNEAARRMSYGCKAVDSRRSGVDASGEYGLLAGGGGLRLAGGGCRIWAKMEGLVAVLGRDAVVLDCAPVEEDGRGLELGYDRVVVRAQIGRCYFELTFDKSNKDAVVDDYLPLVLSRAKEIKEKDCPVKLYTRDCPFKRERCRRRSFGG